VKSKNAKQTAKRRNPSSSGRFHPQAATGLFRPGAIVLLTLNNPREKYWGKLLELAPAGLSLCGIELASFEDATNMFIAGEAFSVATLFFPMHRVERVEIDSPSGAIPSLSQRFLSRTGVEPSVALAEPSVGRQGA